MGHDTIDDLLEAIDQIADTSFDATQAFGANRIAKRPSGSKVKGFYRPGERDQYGAPFEVKASKCPDYVGPPSGRAGNDDEKRGTWPLQNEYLAGRLGKDDIENSALWNTAKWFDQHHRVVDLPASATRTINLDSDNWKDVADREEIAAGTDGRFGVEKVFEDEPDKRIAKGIPTDDVMRLVTEFEELDQLAKLNAKEALAETGPRPIQPDFPNPIDRAESAKIIRILRLGLGTLWKPVTLAIVEHAEMFRLGTSQGAGRQIAPSVGRQRVIEGLRIADSIRRGIARTKVLNEDWYWPARTRHRASIDSLVRDVLAALADKRPSHNNRHIREIA